MLVSDCEASSKPVEGIDSNLGGGTGGDNFFRSKLVQSIEIFQPETLESSDFYDELVENIIPSFVR